MGAEKYGKCYWGVKVPNWVAGDGEVFFHSDVVRVVDGALIGESKDHENRCPYREYIHKLYSAAYDGQDIGDDKCTCNGSMVTRFTLAPRQWNACFAASVMDGHAVAVEHWDDSRHGPGRPQGSVSKERGKMTPQLRYSILKRDNFTCAKCGAKAENGTEMHVDHVRPVSKGGRSTLTNLRTLCADCNNGKSDEIEDVGAPT